MHLTGAGPFHRALEVDFALQYIEITVIGFERSTDIYSPVVSALCARLPATPVPGWRSLANRQKFPFAADDFGQWLWWQPL